MALAVWAVPVVWVATMVPAVWGDTAGLGARVWGVPAVLAAFVPVWAVPAGAAPVHLI